MARQRNAQERRVVNYCPKVGDQKARVFAAIGSKITARHFREADAVRTCARKHGLRVALSGLDVFIGDAAHPLPLRPRAAEVREKSPQRMEYKR
ncbi:MAG: hypothetical protein ACREUC_13275, partial [Steroidobacteraceae bacterium]